MAKVVSVIFLLAMIIQVIRPIGVPGLRKRTDFWKLAVAAMLIVGLTALIRPE